MYVGTRGFIAWLYAVIYNPMRNACKNIYIKTVVHTIGIIVMIAGIYFLITTMPSLAGIAGLFLIVIGLFIFVVPLGVDSDQNA